MNCRKTTTRMYDHLLVYFLQFIHFLPRPFTVKAFVYNVYRPNIIAMPWVYFSIYLDTHSMKPNIQSRNDQIWSVKVMCEPKRTCEARLASSLFVETVNVKNVICPCG